MKICTKCKFEKDFSLFPKKSGKGDGFDSWCKECVKLHQQQRYATNEKDRNRHKNNGLKRRYGITLEEYELLAKEQNYRCKSCGNKETSSNSHLTGICPLAVDHNHKTGRRRGLLCSKCNKALGLLDDSVDKIKALLHYLTQSEAT